LSDVAGEQGVGVGGGVGAADELEDGGAGLGGVEVVGEGGEELLAGLEGLFGDDGIEAGGESTLEQALVEGAEAIDGVGGLEQAVEGEVELVPVGHGDQQEADGRGAVALEQEVA